MKIFMKWYILFDRFDCLMQIDIVIIHSGRCYIWWWYYERVRLWCNRCCVHPAHIFIHFIEIELIFIHYIAKWMVLLPECAQETWNIAIRPLKIDSSMCSNGVYDVHCTRHSLEYCWILNRIESLRLLHISNQTHTHIPTHSVSVFSVEE